jgi:hypothetical protein
LREGDSVRPHRDFLGLPMTFWADVRTVSQYAGYTKGGAFLVPDARTVASCYEALALDPSHLVRTNTFTPDGRIVAAYFGYRASLLIDEAQHLLMSATEAADLYAELLQGRTPSSPQPKNNQGIAKGAPRYLTCLTNLLIEEGVGGRACDYDPLRLTAITKGRRPLRTLSRRVDGAFPSATNPVALWEIKEYYHTTTFGSRVADGVYESQLDGMELTELREHEGIHVLHYLIIDGKHNWWKNGKSYLCRMVDMMHMGHVDEVLVGREIATRLPELVRSWVDQVPPGETARPS